MSWGIVASVAAPIVGGLMGGQEQQQTTERKMDPRMDEFVYGNGGLLSRARDLMTRQSQNGGMNPMQMAGMEAQRQFLTSPAYMAGPQAMMQRGAGLLGGSVAGNPFSMGGNMGLLGRMNEAGQGGGNGQRAMPPIDTSFNYSMNPALQGAMQPIQPQQTQATQAGNAGQITDADLEAWWRKKMQQNEVPETGRGA